MGGCKSAPCNRIAHRIWLWALARNNWLSTSHIPGIDNVEADLNSREFNDRTEWKLHVKEFERIQNHFDVGMTMDLFASRLNCQIPRYVSWNPDPEACATDAFTLTWTNEVFYAFPPFSLIARVVQKVIEDGSLMVLIIPEWTAQAWWPTLQQTLVQQPLRLARSLDVIGLPFNPAKRHPMWHRLRLQACLISGQTYRNKV